MENLSISKNTWIVKGFLHILLIVLTTCYLLLTAPAAHAGIKPPPSNLGLVGYWSMDDCRSTKATDFSGSGNTGTLSGFSYTGSTSNWVTGNAAKRGCALNFDGVNDYVDTGADTPFDFGANPFSVSFWAKRAGTGGSNIVGKYLNIAGWYAQFMADDRFMSDARSDINNYVRFTATSATTDTNWHHYVCVRTTATNIDCYKDDAMMVGTDTSAGTPNVNSVGNLILGGVVTSGDTFFNGSLDDVRVYNRALSRVEVTSLYNSGTAKLKAPDNTGLVGYWSFEDGRGSTATDFSGNGNAGTLTNFALSTTTSNWNTGNACKRGTCLNFDGSNDVVSVADSNNWNFGSNDFSIGSWFLVNAPTGPMSIVQQYVDDNNNWSFRTAADRSRLVFDRYMAGNRYLASAAWTPSLNTWYYVNYVRNGASQYLYINGQSQALDNNNLGSISDLASPLYVGRYDYLGTTYFSGSLDEVRIYNRALSATEIASLYQSGQTKINASTAQLQQGTNLASGLVGHWTFDGKYLTTTTSTDTSGQGNNGTLTGANGKPVPTQGRLGQALSFDGVDDYVSLGNPSSLSPGSGGFSISSWFKTSVTGRYIYWDSTATGGNIPSVQLLVNNNKIHGIYRDASSNEATVSDAGNTVTDNVWHHAVWIKNGTTGTMYLDGVNIGSNTNASLGAINVNAGCNADIGVAESGASCTKSSYFTGSLDDVRVYNRALSANEVLQLYNLGR